VVVADCVAWAAIGTATGYAWHRVPVQRLAEDGWITRPRPFERDGRWYEQRWRIRSWKRFLPEAGGLFRGGYSKRSLRSSALDDLERFRIETRRAEMTHWWVVAWTPVFWLWNPLPLFMAMVAYAIAANVPCTAAQRYNRSRLNRVLARAHAHPHPRARRPGGSPGGLRPEAGSMDGSAPGRRSADG